MNNEKKKFVVREAECILEQCNKHNENNSHKRKINSIAIMIENKRLKRKNIFWKTSTIIALTILLFCII